MFCRAGETLLYTKIAPKGMAHKFRFSTRQAVLLMDQLEKGWKDPKIDHADKIELHSMHQQVQHSLAYEGRLDSETQEFEPPVIR